MIDAIPIKELKYIPEGFFILAGDDEIIIVAPNGEMFKLKKPILDLASYGQSSPK